jgi:uncharacterized membrane protein
MSTVRETIDVAVPASMAYERLTHLENYAQFMSGMMDVQPLTDTRAHMVMDLAGNRAEFDAAIVESRPGEFVCWEAVDGPQVSETLRLEQLSDSMTRVIAEMQIDARQLMPSETHAGDVLNRRLKADLTGFKRYMESGMAPINPGREQLDAMNAPTAPISMNKAAPMRATPATMARGIASAHMVNERPAKGMPATGNLGPMSNPPRS